MEHRYFVAEGPDAEQLKERVLSARDEQLKMCRDLCDQYGTTKYQVGHDGKVRRLGFESDTEFFMPPKGLLLTDTRFVDGKYLHMVRPDMRTKEGKALSAKMQKIKGFNGSSMIVEHYEAARHAVAEGAGPTGFAMYISVGGIVKGCVVLKVPVNVQEPFEPDGRLREIKKSEYIALTEE